MPEDNKVGPSNLFSNESAKPFKPEPDTEPTNEQNSHWATFSGFIPGTILNIMAVLFFFSHYGVLKDDWWQYFLVLLLIVFLIEYWVIYISPSKGEFRLKMAILGLFLIAIGALFLFNPNVWWPIALVVVGHALIIIFFSQRLRSRDISN